MAKMYYSEEEAAARLREAGHNLTELVASGRLRAYPDGARNMYRAADVDALAPGAAAAGEEVELAPADSSAGEQPAVTLSEADKDAEGASKEDTVITSEGISIFDDEDLEIETGDPMAKTAIAAGMEEEVSLEGVGSGSGLLDLTRESDDTSLGEVLEHIDVEAAVPSSPAIEEELPEEPPLVTEPAVVEAPTVVEELDASAGAFAGLVAAACLVMLLAGVAAVAVLMNDVPGYLRSVQQNLGWWLIGGVVVAAALTAVGYAIGKAAATRAAALQRGA